MALIFDSIEERPRRRHDRSSKVGLGVRFQYEVTISEFFWQKDPMGLKLNHFLQVFENL